MQDLDELNIIFFNLRWIYSKKNIWVSSFYKENNFI